MPIRLVPSTSCSALLLTPSQPQVQLHYIGGKTRLLGVNFNEQNTPSIGKDSVDAVQIYTGLDSALNSLLAVDYVPGFDWHDLPGPEQTERRRLVAYVVLG